MGKYQVISAEEALEKHCPFMSSLDQATSCIADDCMAWRWSRGSQTRAFQDEVIARCKAEGEKSYIAMHDKMMAEGVDKEYVETDGYCGLAGDPNVPLRQ